MTASFAVRASGAYAVVASKLNFWRSHRGKRAVHGLTTSLGWSLAATRDLKRKLLKANFGVSFRIDWFHVARMALPSGMSCQDRRLHVGKASQYCCLVHH
jgi:hypothetical protein